MADVGRLFTCRSLSSALSLRSCCSSFALLSESCMRCCRTAAMRSSSSALVRFSWCMAKACKFNCTVSTAAVLALSAGAGQFSYLLSVLQQCIFCLSLLSFTLSAAAFNFGCCSGGRINGFLLGIIPEVAFNTCTNCTWSTHGA